MSETESGATTKAAQKKRRSPVERAIVWGLIAVLLVVVAIEARASLGFRSAFANLQEKLDAADASNTAVTESDVKSIVSGYSGEPAVDENLDANEYNAKREDVYTFSGLIKKHQLYVYYGVQMPGEEREVIRVATEKVKPSPYADIKLPPADVKLGPPGTNSRPPDAPTGDGDATAEPAEGGENPSTPPASETPAPAASEE